MPTYQYVCSNPEGKHEFEVVQSFSDPSLTECTLCSSPVRKVYGSVGVVFKGSGFYRTDSRGNGKSGDGKSGDGKSGDGASTPGAKGESGGNGSSGGEKSSGGKEKAAASSSGSSGGSTSGGSTAA